MLPLAIAGLGMAAVGTVGGLLGANKAAKLQRMQTREQIRRLTREFDATRSMTTAVGGEASGITQDSASLATYLDDMTAEFGRQKQFLRKAGNAAASATQTAATFNAIGSMGGALFSFGAANNWFKTPALTSANV